ncbi:MAG: kelch repeat-containing protein, partial [Gammaproteobacteria bacterium]
MIASNKGLQALCAGILCFVASICAGQASAQAWSQLAPTGGPPVARAAPSAVFNTTTDRMIVFGGEEFDSNHTVLNDVWVLAHADGGGGTPIWMQLNPTGTTPVRVGHSAVYDAANNRMIVFAGTVGSGACTAASNDVWVLTHADGTGGTPAWSQLSPTGGPPYPRYGQSVVYDPASN